MLLKKSTIAFCSCSNLHSAAFALPVPVPASSTTSSCNASTHLPLRQRSSSSNSIRSGKLRLRSICPQSRTYATVSHPEKPHGSEREKQQPHRAESHDHTSWPTTPNPTPYDIFNQKKSAPYNKSRFYELVKIYHPDHHHHHHHYHHITHHVTLSRATKLERYRLIIAANNILCDPVKRRAYDLYGAGWGGRPDMVNDFRTSDRSWRQQPGNAAHNATWEDWEQWYQRRDGDGKKQEPLYMSNGGFVVVILAFVLIGGWGQATRAGTHSLHLVEMEDRRHNHISAEMRKRQDESAMLTREGRVESFLRQREGWGYDTAGLGQTPRRQQEPPDK